MKDVQPFTDWLNAKLAAPERELVDGIQIK